LLQSESIMSFYILFTLIVYIEWTLLFSSIPGYWERNANKPLSVTPAKPFIWCHKKR